MAEPLPVTDADLRQAWDDFYDLEVAGRKLSPPAFNADQAFDGIVLQGLRQVLERDRRRVLERSNA